MFIVTLAVIVAVLLALVVLVQNPKGGGLSGSIAGFSNQFMGVKQTTDVLEKGTWIFAAIVGILCLFSAFFITSGGSSAPSRASDAQLPAATPVTPPAQQPSNTITLPDSGK